MRLGDPGFIIPWLHNHCVPIAFTSVRDGDQAFAVSLAKDARSLDLLNSRGGSPNTYATGPKWAALAGLRVVQIVTPEIKYADVMYTDGWGEHRYRYRRVGAPTVAQFARTNGHEGRWVVLVNRHAISVVDGKVRGWYSPRSRVIRAWRVEIIPQENA